MTKLVVADGAALNRILEDTYDLWNDGLSRDAYGRFYAAQVATAWGRTHLQRYALMAGEDVLASAKLYRFDAELDRRTIQVAGLGAVFTAPHARRRGAARELLERLLERAAADGADLAMLFSEIGPSYYERLGFESIPTADCLLQLAEPACYGAPMTMVRAGDARDLPDLVALGRTRSAAYRFHLDRDRDLVQFALSKKRLLAGLGTPGVREVYFFVAEEGGAAAAYVVVGVRGRTWTLEEAGDRDPTGARVGAILQALVAREPAEERRPITAWLPGGFLPPQVTVIAETPSNDVMMVKPLSERGRPATRIAGEDVCYWRGDRF